MLRIVEEVEALALDAQAASEVVVGPVGPVGRPTKGSFEIVGPWISSSAVADRLGLTSRQVCRLLERHELIGRNPTGRQWEIEVRSVEELAARRGLPRTEE